MDISIIVPVYNKELFLKNCLNSLIDQNVEIILIDDKSTDNSLNILKNYKDKFSNIKLILNDKNLGVAESRNRGLDYSNTKYVGFVDADDYVEKGFYKLLNDEIKKNDFPDIARGNFKLFKYDMFTNKKSLKQEGLLPNCKNGEVIKNKNNFLSYETISCCNKLFKKSFLDKGFIDLSYEDEEFTLRNIIRANTILYLDKNAYCYNMDIGIHYKNNNNINDSFLSVFEIYDSLFKIESKYNDILLDRLMVSIYSKMVCISNWDISDDLKFQIFQKIFEYMNLKYPNWKLRKNYSLFIEDNYLKKYTRFVNKFNKDDSIEKIKTLIKS